MDDIQYFVRFNTVRLMSVYSNDVLSVWTDPESLSVTYIVYLSSSQANRIAKNGYVPIERGCYLFVGKSDISSRNKMASFLDMSDLKNPYMMNMYRRDDLPSLDDVKKIVSYCKPDLPQSSVNIFGIHYL